jgi:hypothetical protein
MTSESKHTPDEIDWSLTTFEGVRREQLRRWAQLPLEDIIRSLEEMEQLAQALHSRSGQHAPRKSGPS